MCGKIKNKMDKLHIKLIFIGMGVLSIIIIVLLNWYFISSAKKPTTSTNNATQESSSLATSAKFPKKAFFIHHSTGEIYWNGGMEKALVDAGYETAAPWWDPETNPPDFYNGFTDPNQWDLLKPYSIIIFKSCFPASDITSDEMLEEYKTYYNQLYEIYEKYPDKLFVPLSTPPLLKNHTTAEAAQRALAFEDWLVGEYKDKYPGHNLAPFKLHSLLSDSEGFLKSDFIASEDDDHPNANSGAVVGPALVNHLKPFVK